MKNSIKVSIAAFVISISFMSNAQYKRSDSYSIQKSDSYSFQKSSIDEQVSVSAKLVNETVYFKLLMQNETKDGVYSLVRLYSGGSFEFVGYKNIVPNDIDQPLLYCLKDNEIPSDDFTYVLYRITSESEIVATWEYNTEKQSIAPVTKVNPRMVSSLNDRLTSEKDQLVQ